MSLPVPTSTRQNRARRSSLFALLAVASLAAVAFPTAAAGSGVSCTSLAPLSSRCEGSVPAAIGRGVFALELGHLLEKGAVDVAFLPQVAPNRYATEPAWECTATAGDAGACDGAPPVSGAFLIVATVEEGAIGKWGWTWTPTA